MLNKLSEKEKKAIEVLKKHGWQIITGPHLEDWDDGQEIKIHNSIDCEMRAALAIVKEDI